MTQEEFIEKFCPSYSDRFNSIKEEYKDADDELISALVNLQDKAFEEALQNFTSKICEKQKEVCANDVYFYVSMDSNPDPEDLREIIDGSFNPSIYDL